MHSTNAITSTSCKKLYIGETRRRLDDRFREHLRDLERNDKDALKPVTRSLLSFQAACGSLRPCPTSRQFGKPQNSGTKIFLSNRPSAFYSTNFLLVFLVTMFPPIAQLDFLHIDTKTTHNFSVRSDEGLTLETSALKLLTMAILR